MPCIGKVIHHVRRRKIFLLVGNNTSAINFFDSYENLARVGLTNVWQFPPLSRVLEIPMSHQKAFLVLGSSLFLLGLLTGLATGILANPRMALSAHIQGLTNGMFLLAVGATWRHVKLSKGWASATFWLLAYGTVMNWVSTTLAALWNTGALTPIHGPQPTATEWQESIVSFGLLSLTIAMIAGTVILLIGYARKSNER